MHDTIPTPPPAGCSALADFEARLMLLQPHAGQRRETTAQRDARERGEKRFNAYGCK